MAKIYYQEDCNLSLLDGKTIAVIGYGSQGQMCIRDSYDRGRCPSAAAFRQR